MQGDRELEAGLPISPLMDRDKPGVMDASNQVYFLDVIIIPMIQAWARLAPKGGNAILEQAKANRQQWQDEKQGAMPFWLNAPQNMPALDIKYPTGRQECRQCLNGCSLQGSALGQEPL